VLFLLLIVPRILIFSKWDAWDGGVSWGPRFLDPVVALFVIAAVEVLVATRGVRRWGVPARLAFGALAIISLGVAYLSVRVPYEQWFDTLQTPSLRVHYDAGHLVPHPNAPGAVSNSFDFTFEGSHVMGNVHLLERGVATMAPWSFQGDRSTEGWALLLAGLLLTSAAATMALRSDRRLTMQAESENGQGTALPSDRRAR
jgi:hypothetical protein